MTEDFVIKYFWSVLGYALMSIPVFFPVARHVVGHEPTKTKTDVHEEVAARTESRYGLGFPMLTLQATFPTVDF